MRRGLPSGYPDGPVTTAVDDAVIGCLLDSTERDELLQRFPPAWPAVIADHITLDAEAVADAALPAPHGPRSFGSNVIYRPQIELVSHYSQAVLPEQFDAFA